ncbi:MAG: HNH endonuclease [Candidatus Rokubacteria bacterium]|nr:HNH endonuclease [Candidatus Rokubacteria bacterium]MBI3454679.1 HNH endonuclease [Candidatus Rokubacteria bacterium]
MEAAPRAYIAVTDSDWYRFLRQRPDLDEVNFWQPSGSRVFATLDPGQPFLFKLHYPDHFIVGGGFFAHASLLPASLAWEAFGEKNGAASLADMRRRVEKYRRSSADARQDYTIGCVVLQDPFFFEREDWIPAPGDFHRSIVQGKTYDLTASPGRELWDVVVQRRRGPWTGAGVREVETPMYGEPTLVRHRLGQGAFRVMVTDIYQRRCAITGEKALPVLEAAHIRPVSSGGAHRLDNGLLLRTDVHTLFDRGYVTVAPDYRFQVSRRLRDDFDNGEYYHQFRGQSIWLPRHAEERPSPEFLEWHADTVFLG